MRRKLFHAVSLCLIASALSACAMLGESKKQPLTITDVNPNLRVIEGTPLDAVKNENITYPVTGEAKYDQFFKDVAVTHGGVSVARTMSNDVNTNLQKYARQWLFNKQAGEGVKALAKDPDAPTAEESGKILAAKKKELGGLEVEEREYFAKAAYNVAAASVTLKASTDAAPKLIPQGQQLLSSAKTDFQMWSAPGVVNELQDSATKLSKVKDDAVPIAKNLTLLTQVLTGLADTTTDSPTAKRSKK